MRRLCLALVHYPVVDRDGCVITTAITNLDLHDIGRSARTFGVSDVFIVHPIMAQRQLANAVKDHWVHGSGKRRIPDRVPPMELLRVVSSLSEAQDAVGGRKQIEVWVTSARPVPMGQSEPLSYEHARQRLLRDGSTVMILFGTGWGLAQELIDDADARLVPVSANHDTGFNHLSVRAACAITLDRLVGARE